VKRSASRYGLTFVTGVFFLCFAACFFLNYPDQSATLCAENQGTLAKAAIVDHLSISHPNPAFVKECTALLQRAGFTVDYYPGKKVTVELYRNLPARGYGLIVFRVHSAYIDKYLSLAMFTSERYTRQRYVYEQLRNRVACGYIQPYNDGDAKYLTITDKFVRFSMKGTFDDTLIVMMGCAGIKKYAPKAFVQRGASAYIGWDGLVSAGHTDRATIRLLKHLLVEGQTIAGAVGKTMEHVGYESEYKSTLLFWPIEAGARTVRGRDNRIEKVARKIKILN